MNIKQVEEWVGESNITPLFTKELIEFKLVELHMQLHILFLLDI